MGRNKSGEEKGGGREGGREVVPKYVNEKECVFFLIKL
jgi:hypothetical protein